MDKEESDRIRIWFEHTFKKEYDGRYHTARLLYDSAWDQRICLACQNEWWSFYLYKSTECIEFRREKGKVMRKTYPQNLS